MQKATYLRFCLWRTTTVKGVVGDVSAVVALGVGDRPSCAATLVCTVLALGSEVSTASAAGFLGPSGEVSGLRLVECL